MEKNKKLIGYRKMAGFTQEDMGKLANMTRVAYSLKETGKQSFTEFEMQEIYKALSDVLKPLCKDLKITDIFF